jgi:hypothetical protein
VLKIQATDIATTFGLAVLSHMQDVVFVLTGRIATGFLDGRASVAVRTGYCRRNGDGRYGHQDDC